MILYHGSSVEVRSPEIYTNGHFKDFGYGFYLTNLEKQARRWAITRRPGGGVVNVYEFEQKKGLGVLKFDEMTESWLDFVVACRRGAEHGYDIVEGPMADDTIWNYVDDLERGEISRAAFWELVKFRYPTHQLVCAPRALSCLTFLRGDKI
ncbi:MAG: DUF3990 domain-containing protein [Eubacteriales bacterium]